MQINKAILLLMTVFCGYTYTEDVTKVLQNGLDGYSGCFDSYVLRTEDDSSTFTQNYEDSVYLSTADCPS